MRRLLLLFVLLAIAGGLVYPQMITILKKTAAAVGFDPTDWEMVLTFGADGSLNGGATFETAPANMLMSSENMTDTVAWNTATVTVNDATHFTATAQFQKITQGPVTLCSGCDYTFYIRASTTGTTDYAIRHEGITGTQTNFSLTGSLTDYAFNKSESGDTTVSWGLLDRNASGWGQVTVSRWALFPGTLNASEAAAAYIKTDDNQDVYDWSGNGNHGTVGSSSSPDTNDPANLANYSRNQAIVGTTEDLTHVSWSYTDASSSSATTWTPSATDGQVVQSFTGISGAVYIVSATIASAGNTSLEWTLDGVETGETVTGSEVRYSIEYTGDGAAANIGLRDPNAAGYGAITFTDFQIEQAPTGSSPTPYTNPASPTYACTACDFDGTDNYVIVDSVAASLFEGTDQPVTLLFLARLDSLSADATLFSQGDDGTGGWPQVEARIENTSEDIEFVVNDDAGGGGLASSNNTNFQIGLWHVLTLSTSGTTATGVMDGTTLTWTADSIDADAIGDTLATVGAYRRSNTTARFVDGQILFVAGDSSNLSVADQLTAQCQIAAMAWDYRGIPVFGADTACSEYDLTTAPQYAQGFDVKRDAMGWVLAQLLPSPAFREVAR